MFSTKRQRVRIPSSRYIHVSDLDVRNTGVYHTLERNHTFQNTSFSASLTVTWSRLWNSPCVSVSTTYRTQALLLSYKLIASAIFALLTWFSIQFGKREAGYFIQHSPLHSVWSHGGGTGGRSDLSWSGNIGVPRSIHGQGPDGAACLCDGAGTRFGMFFIPKCGEREESEIRHAPNVRQVSTVADWR